jgi:hypothetical protein
MADFPGPEEPEDLTRPGNHRFRFDDEGTSSPVSPDRRQPDPQESISRCQLRDASPTVAGQRCASRAVAKLLDGNDSAAIAGLLLLNADGEWPIGAVLAGCWQTYRAVIGFNFSDADQLTNLEPVCRWYRT